MFHDILYSSKVFAWYYLLIQGSTDQFLCFKFVLLKNIYFFFIFDLTVNILCTPLGQLGVYKYILDRQKMSDKTKAT